MSMAQRIKQTKYCISKLTEILEGLDPAAGMNVTIDCGKHKNVIVNLPTNQQIIQSVIDAAKEQLVMQKGLAKIELKELSECLHE